MRIIENFWLNRLAKESRASGVQAQLRRETKRLKLLAAAALIASGGGAIGINAQSSDLGQPITFSNQEVETNGQLIFTTDAEMGKIKVVRSAITKDATVANIVTPPIEVAAQTDESSRDNLRRDTTELVSLDPNNQQFQGFGNLVPSISADGRYVSFVAFGVFSNPESASQVYVRDVRRGTTELISINQAGQTGNKSAFNARISATGRYVVFSSDASDLVANDTNNASDVFVRDRLRGTTERVNLSSAGAQTDSTTFSLFGVTSADGRFVAFTSNATTLVENDTNQTFDIFVRDRLTDTTTLVSRSSAGEQANSTSTAPNISADGRFISFVSAASNLVLNDTNDSFDAFVYDRLRNRTERVSVSSNGEQANDVTGETTFQADISPEGRYVVFSSKASNLVDGDTSNQTDVFLRDRLRRTTERVSLASNETEGNDASSYATISLGGRYVAFNSRASNLVAGDTNGKVDVFVRDLWRGTTERVSLSSEEAQSNDDSGFVTGAEDNSFGGYSGLSISWLGGEVAFESNASNLVTNDANGIFDIFVRKRR